jgi:acyl carrier protein
VLDRSGNPVPIGVPGEIHIGGAGLARGYRGRPELTAERFVPDGLSGQAGERLYRTGDLGRYLPDGRLEFLGRIDTQVKVRGYRIELGEIETVLREQPGVKEAVVVTWQESPQDEARLAAYVVLEDSAEDSTKELRNGLKTRLPGYMLPSVFTFLEKFPLTPNGKIDRKALPAPTNQATSQDVPYVAPTTPVEEQLAAIWKEILKIEKIGIHENFFESGGTSLTATQVISRVRSEFHVEIPLARIFEASTIAEYAELIMQARFEQMDDDTLAQLLAGLDL